MVNFSIIVAYCLSHQGMGKDNQLPWSISDDLKYFRQLTTQAPCGKQNVVIMGRKTWESIPERFRPLSNRFNIVLSKTTIQSDYPDHTWVCNTLEQALDKWFEQKEFELYQVFIIGGQQVYEEAIKSKYCSTIYVTEILEHYDCDTFFPVIDKDIFQRVVILDPKNGVYRFVKYERL